MNLHREAAYEFSGGRGGYLVLFLFMPWNTFPMPSTWGAIKQIAQVPPIRKVTALQWSPLLRTHYWARKEPLSWIQGEPEVLGKGWGNQGGKEAPGVLQYFNISTGVLMLTSWISGLHSLCNGWPSVLFNIFMERMFIQQLNPVTLWQIYNLLFA